MTGGAGGGEQDAPVPPVRGHRGRGRDDDPHWGG